MSMSPTADKIKKIIENSTDITVLSGINTMHAAGLNGVRAEHIAYEIEERYGYSNDEIISSAFFARRGDIFYDYVKNIIINVDNPQPTIIHKAVRQLQQQGKVEHIVTRTVYELFEKAGCENVIDLHGSIEKNKCQTCGKTFGMSYVKHAKGMPVCDVCKVPIRPGFTLLGEQVDNGKVTDASNAVEDAKVLLVIGAAVRDPLCQHLERYYTGDKFILINTQEKHGDDRANYRLYGDLCELVPYVTGYDPDATFETAKKDKNKKEEDNKKEAKGKDE